MKKRTALISIVAALTMILTSAPAMAFAADDAVTGTFQLSNIPSITYVKLYDTAGTPAETNAMTPQIKFDARVKVADADGKADLTNIVVKVWYDSDGGSASETDYDGITAGDADTAIIMTWTEGATFVLTEESNSTWDMVPGDCVAPADLNGEFQFKFTVGKVATECNGSAAKWQVAAKVTDDAVQTFWAADSDGASMAWYGEISVTGTEVNWGTVNPGMDFAEGGSSEENVGNITYICNDDYSKKVSTTATWSATATLDEDGSCTSANEFALKADDTGTLSSAFLVTTAGTTIGNGTITPDVTGTSDTVNGLWLKLASTFAKATYSGTVTYTIAQ